MIIMEGRFALPTIRSRSTSTVAKRPRYSRYRRLPPVFRFGEHKMPDPSQEEQRISLYVPGSLLDRAEEQANRAGAGTVQDYCTELLRRAIEGEHAREQVADLEARRGPLEGLHEIANDPEYLAEWSGKVLPRERHEPEFPEASDAPAPPPNPTMEFGPLTIQAPGGEFHAVTGGPTSEYGPLTVHVPMVEIPVPDSISPAGQVVLRHAGMAGDDPSSFLACLRRGEPVSVGAVSEVAQALRQLEEGYRETRAIDRRVAYALHRLAFEAQVLHTDAWPGAFDDWTVETLRAVQELVDRILSGQDIRYYPAPPRPETAF
jgi:hypothetical protein